ncbi:MAG: hypothetical protein QXJ68_02835 [Methanocellales archaeon]
MALSTHKNLIEIICGKCKYYVKKQNKCKFTGYCSRRSSLIYAVSDE